MPSRHIPESVRRRVAFFAEPRCAECGCSLDDADIRHHLDHRTAFSEGGEHVAFNLDLLCPACNQAKGAGTTERTRRLQALRERRQAEIRAYFQETNAHIVGNERLREPQAEGYLALRDHFAEATAVRLPALTVLPTGCGKSGLIACAPFGIAEGRVLVVTPNLTIKSGLVNGTLAGASPFYDFCQILPPDVRRPRVVALERGRVNEEDCLRADIIVANVQQMQSWLGLFPSDFFDLILVDEAHHAPADSWQDIHDAFPEAKGIYLTATPFRSDDKPIQAEAVYTYRLADAIAAGYVKNIVRVDAVASEMTFVMEGEDRSYTREEILNLREERWFSRGVALSDVCNATIVDRSVQLLQAKRQRGTEHHQIIAAACSIRHAERIAAFYQSRGLRASFVASRGMSMEERDRRLAAYDAGQIDAMVHVGILGEGYDNAPISIAAIFRPFRSTAPYTQFVGRAIRALPNGNATDNVAHVVAHAGLNQEGLWGYFKNELAEANVVADFTEWDTAQDGTGDADATGTERREPSDPPEVTRETIEGFDVDHYLPVDADADAAQDHLRQMADALDGLREQGLNVPDAETLEQEIAALNAPLADAELPPPPTRPERERSAYRTALDHAVKRAAGTIVHVLDLTDDHALARSSIGDGTERSNYAVVIRLLNRAVNDAMGYGSDASGEGRNAWLLDDLKAAKHRVSDARDAVLRDIRDALETQEPVDGDRPEPDASPADASPEDASLEDTPPSEDVSPPGDAVPWDDVDNFDWGEPF